jgi:NHL repeat
VLRSFAARCELRRLSPGPTTWMLATMILVLAPPTASARYEFATSWGETGTGDGEFQYPTGVATDSHGNVYVVDSGNSRIQKFTPNGTFLTRFGSAGPGDGQFDFPADVAVDSDDNIYVAEILNDRIQKFDSGGNFISKWGSAGPGDGQFGMPTAVATDSDDNVYVVDSGNHRIQKFDSAGNFISKWGDYGADDGQFLAPAAIATDSKGSVYVGDGPINGSRVQKFDPTGDFITSWTSPNFGIVPGRFGPITAIATDPTDNVLVGDGCAGFRCPPTFGVQKFDSSGEHLTNAIPIGTDPEFLGAAGIATHGRAVYSPSYEAGFAPVSSVVKYVEVLPETTITSGPSGSTNDKTPSFGLSSDSRGAKFRCRLDGAAFEPCANPFATNPLDDGPYTVEARAIDNAGSIDDTPASRSFTVDTKVKASASSKETQTTPGKKIKIRVNAKANEDIRAKAGGKVKVNPTYGLRPSETKLAQGQSAVLKLTPRKRENAKRIARALKRGKGVWAMLTVKLTDEAGSTKSSKLQVKLTR